jgi:uncharacterized protein (TIGR02118 family)
VIKVSVLYPNTAGCKFDMGYYLNQHMPMVQQKLGPACKRMAVEEGIAGGGARDACDLCRDQATPLVRYPGIRARLCGDRMQFDQGPDVGRFDPRD